MSGLLWRRRRMKVWVSKCGVQATAVERFVSRWENKKDLNRFWCFHWEENFTDSPFTVRIMTYLSKNFNFPHSNDLLNLLVIKSVRAKQVLSSIEVFTISLEFTHVA